MGLIRTPVPLVGFSFHVAAAENYNPRCCIYLADHIEERSERIWCKWAQGQGALSEKQMLTAVQVKLLQGHLVLVGGCDNCMALVTVPWPCWTVSKTGISLGKQIAPWSFLTEEVPCGN